MSLSGSMTISGLFCFQTIVVLVNIKILVQSNTHTWLSWFWQLGSIANFYVAFASFSYSEFNPNLRDLMPLLLDFVSQYILLFFCVCSYILIEQGSKILEQEINDIIEKYEEIEE